MVLAIILLVVALLSVIALVRQLKIKNYLAILFAAASTVTFGFFSIATIICSFTSGGFCA